MTRPVALALITFMFAACEASIGASDAPSPPAPSSTPVVQAATTQPTPSQRPAPSNPPAVLTFGKITSSANACFDLDGGAVARFSLPVKVKGRLPAGTYLWIVTQGIDAFSGPTLESTNFDGRWSFPTDIFSDFRGLFLLRVPKLTATGSTALKWEIRDALFGRQSWNVLAYTGPETLKTIDDLTPTDAAYGPILIRFTSC